jgi:alpha-L-rhamnosidase
MIQDGRYKLSLFQHPRHSDWDRRRSLRYEMNNVKLRQPFVAFAVLLLCSTGVTGGSSQTPDGGVTSLVRGFENPPPEARPHVYWLWLNGYINREFALEELKAMKAAGFSGVLAFDMGARGPEDLQPPAGPAFLSADWLHTFRQVVGAARDLGVQVDFSVINSWDLGARWVEPRHASMGLYTSETTIQGGQRVDVVLPFPYGSLAAPKGPDGKPAFWKDVATVAVPSARMVGHEFILRLDPDRVNDLREAVFDNGTPDAEPSLAKTMTPARQIALGVSSSGTRGQDFQEVLRASLPAAAGPTRFPLPAGTKARYVRLTLLSGHDVKRPRWTLGEFSLFNERGENVAASRHVDRLRPGALMVRYSTPLGYDADWNLDNLHDGDVSGSDGVFATVGLPPLRYRDAAAAIDLTKHVDASGRLRWDAPRPEQGAEWTVLRYVCMNTGERLKVPSPNSDGWATDHLNADATRAYMQHVVSGLKETFGDLRKSGLRNLYLASYEVRGPVWSPTFTEEFRRLRGYDMTPYLPLVFGGRLDSEEMTDRFLFDYRKTLGEVLVDAYYRAARDVTAAAGLTIKSEAGGPGPPMHNVPVDALLANGAVDEIQGEFWPKRWNVDGMWVVKETATAGHLYGKRLIHMEAFTSDESWAEGPQDLKPSADRVFTEGANHMVWHTWAHAPPESGRPGWAYYAGTHINRNVTWWPQVKPWVDYLSRASFLLQQGTFVGDVLYYYGDGGFNFVGPRRNEPSLGPGYDYDVINMDVLVSSLTVRSDGRLAIPNGSDYGILVLPDRTDIHPRVLAKVEQLVGAGATVVGLKPLRASGLEGYPASDRDVGRLADRLWGTGEPAARGRRVYGKGTVVWGTPLREILAALRVEPDFTQQALDVAAVTKLDAGSPSVSPTSDSAPPATGAPDAGAPGGPFDFIHRRDGTTDIYFIRNTLSREASARLTFRAAGRQPELWNATTGDRERVAVYEVTGGRTQMTLTLPAHGSTFVVFARPIEHPTWVRVHPVARVRFVNGVPTLEAEQAGEYTLLKNTGERSSVSIDALPAAVRIETGWTLAFPEGMGAPPRVPLPRLGSWTDHDNPGVRYFSGTARYTARFSLPSDWTAASGEVKGRRVYLDLGALWSIAEVWVNGHSLGVVWTDPFRVDCTRALRSGENELVVDVTNSWHNRLVGDASLPPEQRLTRTNVLISSRKPWSELQPIPSGLFGPVTLTPVAQVPISASAFRPRS